MTDEEIRVELVRFVKEEFGTITKAAAAWDVSVVFISKVARGQKPIPEWMLNKIGYARKIVKL